MIGVRDVTARVPDLLPAQHLVCAPHAIGGVQDCGDPGAAPPGEHLASAGHTPSPDLSRPCPAQRAGPTAPQDPSPTSICHPRHALALAHRLGYTTMDHQEPATQQPPTHVTAAAQGDSASRQREPGLGIPAHRWRTCRHGPSGRRLHGLGNPHTRRNGMSRSRLGLLQPPSRAERGPTFGVPTGT